jgi:hypothetical protein
MADDGTAEHSWPNGLLGKHRAEKLFSVFAPGVARKGLRERSTHEETDLRNDFEP